MAGGFQTDFRVLSGFKNREFYCSASHTVGTGLPDGPFKKADHYIAQPPRSLPCVKAIEGSALC